MAKREIRSASLVGVAGVGAIVDVGNESFVMPAIDQWWISKLRKVELQRLSTRLRKQLMTPIEDSPFLRVRRFPKSIFCESCRAITKWRTELEEKDRLPRCPACNKEGTMVPMRFVVACENGHLDDFPWSRWAHSGPSGDKGCRVQDRLKFMVNARAGTAGLESLLVECGQCHSSRSLDGISSRDRVKGVLGRCTGRHPWSKIASECEAAPEVLQRGATNLHYPAVVSALDIPVTDTRQDLATWIPQVRSHDKFSRLCSLLASTEGDFELIHDFADMIAVSLGADRDTVMQIATTSTEGTGASEEVQGKPGSTDQAVILEEEWTTLSSALNGGLESKHFKACGEPLHPQAPVWARRLFGSVLLVSKMREVRAYVGFQRVRPTDKDTVVPPDVSAPKNWVPAVENHGEGIFLNADADLMQRWAEALPAIVKKQIRGLEGSRQTENFWFLPEVTAQLFALHTLSHLLLRRLTFECGYASSALKERLYVTGTHAGLMIFTSDGDSEGSLGGLVRQGKEDRLAQTLFEAVEQGRWCSADPVCSETAGQGLGGFNQAACHACLLVSETSCTMTNALLDRRLLVDPHWGLIAFAERAGQSEAEGFDLELYDDCWHDLVRDCQRAGVSVEYEELKLGKGVVGEVMILQLEERRLGVCQSASADLKAAAAEQGLPLLESMPDDPELLDTVMKHLRGQ